MDRLDAAFQFGKEALDLRVYRQQVLTSNIANADTPGYQARDVDFSSALPGALARSGWSSGVSTGTLALAAPSAGVGAGTGGVTLATDAPNQLAGSSNSAGEYGTLMYRNIAQP